MKLFLVEPGSDHIEVLWRTEGPFASSAIGYPEARGAIARAARERRISTARSDSAVEALDEAWSKIHVFEVDRPLGLFAGALAARHGLRTLDAVHLGSALSLAKGEPVVVSWDDELRRAAAVEGLALSPV